MSRRIACLFAVAACATLAAPAGADPECFDGVCRMPQVMEPPQPLAQAVEEPAPVTPESQNVVKQEPPGGEVLRAHGAPETIRPQMRVDDLSRPALRPLPQRPVETANEEPPAHPAKRKPARQVVRHAPPPAVEEQGEPVEVVGRRYAAPQPRVYAVNPYTAAPTAGVVVVAPGAQYGEDGIAIANAPQDPSWRLCQGSGRNRCIQYNYQPYGAYGYRPLGTYRAYRQSPGYVYVPDAKVITVD